jgi:transcriptional regulator with XRE-family HTH domain
VRAFRAWRGLTIAELAHRVGIAPPYLSQIETGKRDGTLSVMHRIAKALELPLDLLVTDDSQA